MLFFNTLKKWFAWETDRFFPDILQKQTVEMKSRSVVVQAESYLPVSFCLSLFPLPLVSSLLYLLGRQNQISATTGLLSFSGQSAFTNNTCGSANHIYKCFTATGNLIQGNVFVFILWFSLFLAPSKEVPCGGWIRPVPCAAREEGWKRERKRWCPWALH